MSDKPFCKMCAELGEECDHCLAEKYRALPKTRTEILKAAGTHPRAFTPANWHEVKKILRLFEQ